MQIYKFKYIIHFGFDWGILAIIDNIYQFIFKRMNRKIFILRCENAKKYLYKYIDNNFKYLEKCDKNVIGENSNIYVYWHQGLHNMPTVVKKCYERTLTNCNNHKVILLTNDNIINYYKDYYRVLSIIENKHFKLNFMSDILKAYFLYTYGGIWIDATVFLNDNIDSIVNVNLPFFSMVNKHSIESSYDYWSAYFLASGKEYSLFKFLYDVLIKYIENEDKFIYYFLIDVIISIYYDKSVYFNNDVKKMLKWIETRNYLINSKLVKTTYKK